MPATFESDRTYDTVTVVGAADESNPLFVYASPWPQLLDERTVVYSDLQSEGGRMVVADLIDGTGWEIESVKGADGPGEFGGRTPFLYPHAGVIHAMDDERVTRWSRAGDLLSSRRSEPRSASARMNHHPGGIAGGKLVMKYMELVDASGPPEQRLPQNIRIYDLDDGSVTEVTHGIPDVTWLLTRRTEGGANFHAASGAGLEVHARGETIVWFVYREHAVTILNPQGEVLARREFDPRVIGAFVDADERVWVQVAARDEAGRLGYIVMDRELNELFRVAALGVRDASGDAMLALESDDFGLIQLVLLRMRER